MLNDKLSDLLGVCEAVPPMKETSKVHFRVNSQMRELGARPCSPAPARGIAVTGAAFRSKVGRERQERGSPESAMQANSTSLFLLGCQVQRELWERGVTFPGASREVSLLLGSSVSMLA